MHGKSEEKQFCDLGPRKNRKKAFELDDIANGLSSMEYYKSHRKPKRQG